MHITFDVASDKRDFTQILQLQKKYIAEALSEEEQKRQGFLSVTHTVALLEKMSSYLPQTIAMDDKQNVIGYTLAMPLELQHEAPHFISLFEKFKRVPYKGKSLSDYRYWVGGQVCVDVSARGQDLLSRLYRHAATQMPKEHRLCITDIATINARSLHCHHKMGFETVHTYLNGDREWQIVVWDVQAS